MSHAGGRPTKYTHELLEKARKYANGGWIGVDPVPMLCGLAVECGINKGTVSDWRSDPDKPEFSEICARVEVEQERILLQKGLDRTHDNSLTKLMLMKHGYTDRSEIDHTTKGEKINSVATAAQLESAKKAIMDQLANE